MYHCHIRFYLVGRQRELLDLVKEALPLERFTHEFVEGSEPDWELASQSDVILADLRDMDPWETLCVLASGKREEAQLILLASQEQIALLEDLSNVTDIWRTPMSERELHFRFQRWQETCKMSKDFWQASHFLEATIDNTPNLIWYKDKDGVHEKVNESFCQTVNKTKAQVEGRRHAYIWDVEQDDPACIESERIVMESRETCVAEEQVRTGAGDRLLTTYKSPLYDLDGSVMGTVGVGIDVTQERAYEREIIKKNQTMETLFTTLDCGVMCHSLDGAHIFSINRAALRILGYDSPEEMLEAGFDMVAASVLDEDKGMLRKSIEGLRKEGDSVSVEYRVRHPSGEILHVMGSVKLVNEDGNLFYQRFLLDCTEQKLQEQKHKRHQMELVQALSIDYNLVCYVDLNTGLGSAVRIDECREHVLDTVFAGELSLQDSFEQYIQRCVYADDRGMVRQALTTERLERELIENRQYYLNYRVICGGELRYFQMKAVRPGDWEGSHGVVLGFRSVDRETRMEMEKKSLLEDALMQANRASKAKSAFLSNMSHDIRTPMNAIVGFTGLAIAHIDRREQVEEYLKKIMASGNHLLSLINDILDMSRIESGKMHLDEKACSLPEILHSLRSIVQAEVHAKQLELCMDAVDVVDEDIYCDKLRLNQVLLNLLSNAVKYTGAGGTVSLRVTEKTKALDGYAMYEFCVKDTGIGMSEEFVTHIFEPFEREQTSTISGIQGTGLGMAITKNIVDMMNGAIEVKSEQGVGTEVKVAFTFRLRSGVKESQAIPELKDFRALVVDDDFNACDSVSYMLQQIGMRAEWTLSGKEAILRTRQAVMRKDNYRVYIVDWLLPDINGIEVIRRIRKETGEDVPVIVLTAYDWSDIEEEAREAGVSAFCSKPLFLSELRSCLRSIVNTEEAEEEKTDSEKAKPRSGRILLAEDNELNQEIAVAILGEAGFSTDVAENGQIAVEMLTRSEPGYYQLVLMDVQMPVMNGYEATQAIRALENPELSEIPIIAMTANAFEEDKQEALRHGMNGHISKPIDVNNLFDMLDKVLD